MVPSYYLNNGVHARCIVSPNPSTITKKGMRGREGEVFRTEEEKPRKDERLEEEGREEVVAKVYFRAA